MAIKLKQQGAIALGGLALSIFSLLGVLLLTRHQANVMDGKLEKNMDAMSSVILPLDETIAAIKLDVVQVQQFMTDISATRGLNGLDDGLDVAAAFASKFKTDSERAMALARSAGLEKVINAIREVQAAFPDFYATGQKMAHAYISNGPAGGNALMPEFDAAAQQAGTALDHSRAAIVDAINNAKAEREILVDQDEKAQKFTLVLTFIVATLSFVILILIVLKARDSLNVVVEITKSMTKASKGKLDVRMDTNQRQDEIGTLQDTFNRLMAAVSSFVQDADRCMAALERADFNETIATDDLMGDFAEAAKRINNAIRTMADKNSAFAQAGQTFEGGVKQNYDTINGSIVSLKQTSMELLDLAKEAAQEAENAEAASSTSAQGVQTVATATEELSASIQEIARQVANSAKLVSASSAEAMNASEQIRALSETSEKIGNVVEMITGIAEQTNLLALNATIESARAGEAGKGFAVVAQEVKALASQTGSATDEVRAQVDAIQEQTRAAVEVIEAVSNRMSQVNDAVAAIAASVEQQGAATNEISSSIDTVNSETSRMLESIVQLRSAIEKTRSSAGDMDASTTIVNDASSKVVSNIDTFMDTMKRVVG